MQIRILNLRGQTLQSTVREGGVMGTQRATDPSASFRERIRSHAKAKRMTIEVLATRCNVNRGNFYRWLERPSENRLQIIGDALTLSSTQRKELRYLAGLADADDEVSLPNHTSTADTWSGLLLHVCAQRVSARIQCTSYATEIGARIGAGAQALDANRLGLALDGLDGRAEGAQAGELRCRVGAHVVLADRYKVDVGVVQDARLVGGAVIGLVGVDPGAGRQAREEFMDGSQVMVARGEQDGGDRHTSRGADQVQAPSEVALLLGGAVATVGPASDHAAVLRPHLAADRQRQAIQHKVVDGGLSLRDQRAQCVREQFQPIGQRVQAAIEVRRRDRVREIVAPSEHADRAFAMIAKIERGKDGHREHLRVAHASQAMAAMPYRFHRVVNHDIDRYNQGVVHKSSFGLHCRQATVVSSLGLMCGN